MGTHAKRLAKGRKIRHQQRAQFDALKTRHTHIEDVLGNPSNALGRCRVYAVLRATPGIGETGVKKILQHARVWPEDRLASLSREERQRIIDALPPRVRR